MEPEKLPEDKLESGEFDIIKMDVLEKDAAYGFSRNLQTWLVDFTKYHMVYEDDIEMFLEKTNLHALREHFEENNM
ncbi:MAG: hypothetical protein MR316_02805 [Lachnospiraceae bacterium]|nr:hypothetical protein [Lachnospiraceae bacterium]